MKSFGKGIEVFSAGTEPAAEVNKKAVKVMADIGIDISRNKPKNVNEFVKDEWDFVVTVCGGANEKCPLFIGKVKNRLHMPFDDPSEAKGSDEFINSEFVRVRDEIKKSFYELYLKSQTNRVAAAAKAAANPKRKNYHEKN